MIRDICPKQFGDIGRSGYKASPEVSGFASEPTFQGYQILRQIGFLGICKGPKPYELQGKYLGCI